MPANERFARFCEKAAAHLGDLISLACTLNEPNIAAVLSYLLPFRIRDGAWWDDAARALFMMGLAALPLADVEAIRFSAPLMITFLSVMILGEKVGPRRWLSLLERHPIYPAPSYSASWDTASFDVIQTGANAAL